ncbi:MULTISPECIES: phosphate acyltransferase PlsX [unclassified Granulicatella]|uniref:phosphate acyltransferase PlsX n=1 Tax=unclassified Granulicatella TaxID=2630493 RepID=UPI0010733F65|nr:MULTISPECIES: phosphate acyltransferase PlsX [unclassified Granulicatella]MBF0779822.1 phosphate acyltransferase PlsX [Granulicatella sp. 19428wC4_WM01]TFU96122.1 phosphate acyltransferase PlsX [Granulicatella sp. WM01]
MYKIAVDAMGGDNAPKAIIEGVIQASETFEDIEYVLYGDENQIKPYLTGDNKRISIVHTTEKIASDDEPVKAIRSKKQASMVLAAQAVKNKEADALFSAGNTGALLAAGLFIVGRIKGIERPGLMPTLPVMTDTTKCFVFMDVGANADCKAKHLVQFALLGNYYAQTVLGIDSPRVALLNNGTEASKGNELAKQSHELLVQQKELNFIGNVEARELMNGKADVVVTDGFTGNAVLKSVEGTAMALIQLIKATIKTGNLQTKIGGLLVKDALRNIKDVLDYSKHGGAVLFGLKAPVVKTHGSADKTAVFYTIKQIRKILDSHVIDNVNHYFETKESEIS